MGALSTRAARALFRVVVAACAVAALVATGLYTLVGTPVGTSILVPRVLALVNGAIQGTVELESFRLLSRGAVELRGARVRDPDGEVVLEAERAVAKVDVLLLRLRTIAAEIEIEDPKVLLARTPEGQLTLAQAFQPRRPSPKEEEPGESRWTVRLDRLEVRRGAVELVAADGTRQFAARSIDIDGRAATSRAGSDAEVRATADVDVPAAERVSIDAAASMRGGVARVYRLQASAGDTALDALGEWDVAARSGRALVRSVAISAEDLRQVLPQGRLSGDVQGTLFAAAEAGVVTAAFDLSQAETAGRAAGGAALRMSGPLTVAVDVALEKLDPARVVAAAPQGDVTLRARGWLQGTDPRTFSGAIDVDASPSSLRDARFGPVKLRGNARAGAYQVEFLDATVPGARVRGSGRLDRGGGLAAGARLEGSDLAAAAATVERLAAVELPKLAGAATLSAELSGTTRAPRASFDLAAPRLTVSSLAARDLVLAGKLAGTRDRPQATVNGKAGELRFGAEVIRAIELAASIDDRAAEAKLTAVTLRVGPDPLTIGVRGALARDWRSLDVADLSVAWPGTRYALTAPARLEFAGPRVDRLELASGPTRIALEGGLGRVPGPRRRSPPQTVADARVTVQALDLAALPRELLPPSLGVSGVVALDARASGPLSRPEVVAHVEASEGTILGVAGLTLAADATWDGAARRARVAAAARRAFGGEVEVRADFPAALGKARASEPIALTVSARGLPLDEAARLANRPEAIGGLASVDIALTGTVGDPALTARALLAEVRYGEYGPYELDAALEAPGETAKLDAAVSKAGQRTVELTAAVPLVLADLLREPARTARAIPGAPLQAEVSLPEHELAPFAGEFGLPADLAGRLRGGADIRGSLHAPRGSLGVEADGVTAYGYRDASLQLAILLTEDTTGLAGSVAVAGEELVQLSGFLGSPVERLGDAVRVEQVPMEFDAILPGADLALTGGRVPLAGRLGGRLRATGSLAKPTVNAVLDGTGVSIAGKPLGDAHLRARAAGMTLDGAVEIAATAGGSLTATLRSTAEMSLDALRRGDIRQAPSELRVVADRLDLGVLPALLPGTIRSASGEVGADLAAKGPLSSLRPVGTLRVTNGRAAIAEMGEWSGIEVDATLTADVFKVDRLQAARGRGTLDATAEARGLAGIVGPNAKPAQLTAQLRARSLTVTRAGQDLATLDLDARATGTFDAERLKAEVTVPRGTVVLPERSPRAVQSLEKREDIVIVSTWGESLEKDREREDAEQGEPYRATVRVLLPNRFFITSANPRMNIELQADATFDVVGSHTYAEGQVEVLRGFVEPIGGRNFTIERGRVTFTGSEPSDAVLDVVARYENPSADVTVNVSGSTKQPIVKMSSEPPMDEAQIAMLIATGRTELKAGSGGVGTLTGEEAGRAALGAVATQLFKNVVADKLPVDSVALSSSEIRAGKYVTDKIYVGYTRNFEAQVERNENVNEVRVEYQISPRWTFESRYGDARTGGASIIWSKDY